MVVSPRARVDGPKNPLDGPSNAHLGRRSEEFWPATERDRLAESIFGKVTRLVRRMTRPARGDSVVAHRIYLANLPSSAGEAEVRKLFSDDGISVVRLEYLYPGAFYVWLPEKSCHYAISALNGKEYEGGKIRCEFSVPFSHPSKADFSQTLHEGRRVTTSGQRDTKFSSRPPKSEKKH